MRLIPYSYIPFYTCYNKIYDFRYNHVSIGVRYSIGCAAFVRSFSPLNSGKGISSTSKIRYQSLRKINERSTVTCNSY